MKEKGHTFVPRGNQSLVEVETSKQKPEKQRKPRKRRRRRKRLSLREDVDRNFARLHRMQAKR